MRSPLTFAALAACTLPLGAQTDMFERETRALELKSRGDYRGAQRAFLKLLEDPASDERAAAAAEFQATLAQLLALRRGDWSAIRVLRERAARAEAEGHPFLRDRCLHLALALAQACGEHAAAADLTHELGYVHEWILIGPFDNERGSGWARAFGPEREIDLDATYDGKKRPVQWRHCPVQDAVGGLVDLDALVRPNDQVLCYVATALVADRPTSAVLHLGTDEAAKVFVNGVEVWGRDVRRRFAPDQDAVRIELAGGPNLLVVKVCDQEGPFAFAARLRTPDGLALRGVRASTARDDLTAAAATEALPTDAAEPARGALTVLARDFAASGDPLAAFRLAMLLAMRHPDDPTERRDHELAKRALDGLPDLPAARYLLAFTRVREGAAETRDENPRRRDYELLLERFPWHAEAARSLAELELESSGIATRAIEIIRPYVDAVPEFSAGHLALADAYDRLGLPLVASASVERAAATDADGVVSPLATIRRFARLAGAGRWREAAALAEARLRASFDPDGVVAAAEACLRVGDRSRAVAILERGIAHLPFAADPRYRLAALHEAERDIDLALRTLRDWLSVCPEDDDALARVAHLHGLAGDTDHQREALRSVVELNPNRKVERRQLEFLLVDETPFYAAFEIDYPVSHDVPVPGNVAEANVPFYHFLRHEVVRAYRNGTTSEYQHRVVRILTEQGARELATFFVPHYWGEQRARLLGVRVVKVDGSEIRPRISGGYVRMPPLTVGDTCEIRYRVDDLAPTFFGDYFGFEHRFTASDGSPVARAVLDLVLDVGRDYRMQVRNGAPEPSTSTVDGAQVHRFEMRDLPHRKLEELRPSLDESDPLVRVTTYRDWDHFANWWWNLIRKQSELTPEMRAKVAELTDGLESTVAKIDAIYRFVTTEIQYKAWEFGVHGYKPYSTPVIFERRHGDCKDKALLMNVMLAEIGVEAYPVLIHADPRRSADDLSLALVQHFNHCISYLPATHDHEEMFLDGTATYHPLDTLPEMDQGADVLVVDSGTGRIEKIDWVDALDNLDDSEFIVELEPSGDAAVTLLLTPKRNAAVDVRQALANEPAKQTETVAQRLAEMFGSAEVVSVDTSDLLDLNEPVRVEIRFRCDGLASVQDGALVLRPTFVDDDLQGLTSASERRFAMILRVPATESQRITYRLPGGFQPVELPPPTEMNERFGEFRVEWSRVDDRTIRVERSRSIRTNRIEPAEYPTFREFATSVEAADREVVLAKRRSS